MKQSILSKVIISLFSWLILYLGLISVNALVGQDGTPDGTPTFDPLSLAVGGIGGLVVGLVLGRLFGGGKIKTGHVTLIKREGSISPPESDSSEETGSGSELGKKHQKTGHVTILKRGEEIPSSESKNFNPVVMDKGLRRGIEKDAIKRNSNSGETGGSSGGTTEEPDAYHGSGVKVVKDMGGSVTESSETIKEVGSSSKKEFKGHVTLLK